MSCKHNHHSVQLSNIYTYIIQSISITYHIIEHYWHVNLFSNPDQINIIQPIKYYAFDPINPDQHVFRMQLHNRLTMYVEIKNKTRKSLTEIKNDQQKGFGFGCGGLPSHTQRS